MSGTSSYCASHKHFLQIANPAKGPAMSQIGSNVGIPYHRSQPLTIAYHIRRLDFWMHDCALYTVCVYPTHRLWLFVRLKVHQRLLELCMLSAARAEPAQDLSIGIATSSSTPIRFSIEPRRAGFYTCRPRSCSEKEMSTKATYLSRPLR